MLALKCNLLKKVIALKHFEENIGTENIYDGRILGVRRDKVRLEDGNESIREVISHTGGACIVAIDDEDNILMVQQFRYPFGRVLTEIPAGKLEKGEAPRVCAVRELMEETGFEAGRVIYLGENLATPAYDEEVIHIFYGDRLKKGERHLDEGEFLDVYKIPFEEAVKKVLEGEIKDGKTSVGILKTKLLRDLGRI